jgi:hypothetical protein
VPVKYSYANGGLSKAKNRLRSIRHSAESNLSIEYLREYEFIFETALVLESGDPGLLFAENTGGQKSLETVPLIGWIRSIWFGSKY